MRKAKVTEENLEEAKRLMDLWKQKSTMSQAEFGETFNIGNQSAVGQFLNGLTPLSLKAAAGFAKGLQCTIVDFSPRLADQAAEVSMLSGLEMAPKNLSDLKLDEIELVLRYRKASEDQKTRIQGVTMKIINEDADLLLIDKDWPIVAP